MSTIYLCRLADTDYDLRAIFADSPGGAAEEFASLFMKDASNNDATPRRVHVVIMGRYARVYTVSRHWQYKATPSSEVFTMEGEP